MRTMGWSGTDVDEAKESPGSLFALGVVMIMLGAAAVLFPLTATLATELVIGGVLLVAGIFQSVVAFRQRRWRGFFFALVSGLLAVAVGVLLLLFPLAGILSLTLIVAAFFLLQGIFRIAHALRERPRPGFGWLLFSGVLSTALGALIFLQWPAAATWLLGLLVGLDLLMSGGRNVWLSVAMRRGQGAGSPRRG